MEIELPVHLAGEIDGTVYAGTLDGQQNNLGNVRLALYDINGEEAKATVTSGDGFYLFDLVPPGQYLMMADSKSVPNNTARPIPQTVDIGYDGTTLFGNDIMMFKGRQDVPSTISPSLADLKRRHPHVDFDQDPNVVLNLGEYKSNLLMTLSWLNIKLRHNNILKDGQILVRPSQSNIAPATKKHELLIGFPDDTIDEAYGRCRTLMNAGITCEVDILPGAIALYAMK